MICSKPKKCWCPECRREYDRDRHQRLKDKIIPQKRLRAKALLEWVRSLKENPCTDCQGTFHPAAMQFDHLRDKIMDVADMVRLGYSRDKIMEEISKCELVCANCHAVRTFERR